MTELDLLDRQLFGDYGVAFRVYGLPQTKGSTRARPVPGKPYANIVNDNAKNKPWAMLVSHEARCARMQRDPYDGAVILRLQFFMRPPKGLPKRRESFAIKRPDLDKMIRSIKDALSSILYRDDSQVVMLIATKEYSLQPGVQIRCRELSATHALSYRPAL